MATATVPTAATSVENTELLVISMVFGAHTDESSTGRVSCQGRGSWTQGASIARRVSDTSSNRAVSVLSWTFASTQIHLRRHPFPEMAVSGDPVGAKVARTLGKRPARIRVGPIISNYVNLANPPSAEWSRRTSRVDFEIADAVNAAQSPLWLEA